MKIGVISDIHSNYRALKACLDYLKKEEVDIYLLLGDYVSDTPCPEKVMEQIYDLLANHEVHAVRGNREDYQLDNRTGDSGWKDGSATGNLLYTKEHLSGRDYDFFAKLPIFGKLVIEGYPTITYCHGSPDSTRELLFRDTEKAKRWLSTIDTEYLIAGHTHLKCHYTYNGKTYINTGSCGIPINNPGNAECVILTGNNHDWDTRFVSLPYDVYGVIDEMFSSGLYERAHWFMNSNIQTLITGVDRASDMVGKAYEIMNASGSSAEGTFPSEEQFEAAAKILGVPDYSNNRHPELIRMDAPDLRKNQ